MAAQKLVMVCHYYPPHVGGLEAVAAAQAKSLADHGFAVAVITASQPMAPADEAVGKVAVHRVPAWNFFDRRFGIPFPIFSPRLAQRLWRHVAQANVVHVHDVFYMSSWVAALAAWRHKKPLFITQHVGLVDHPSKVVRGLQRLVYATVGQWLFMRAERIVVYNRNVYNFVLAHGVSPQRITEARNGVNVRHFTPVDHDAKRALRAKYRLPADKPAVLYVGRLVPKKGYNLLLQAVQGKPYIALFVGPGKQPDHPPLGARFLGPRRGDALRELYQLSDVCVIPSQGELFTLVHQEAMACGLPIITSDDPGYASYNIDRQAMQFVPRTAKAIGRALDHVLANDAARWHMSNYSRRLATEQFNWDDNMQRLIDLYTQKAAV